MRVKDDNEIYTARRQLVLDRFALDGDASRRNVGLAECDMWRDERYRSLGCFTDEGYAEYQDHYSPPSLAGEVWLAYRRLAGNRSMIVIPMGGVVPGVLQWDASQAYLESKPYVFDPDDYELVRMLWDQMDDIAAEHDAKSRGGNE